MAGPADLDQEGIPRDPALGLQSLIKVARSRDSADSCTIRFTALGGERRIEIRRLPGGGLPGVWGSSAKDQRSWQSVLDIPKRGVTRKANSYLVLQLLMGVAVRAAKATGSDVARFVPIDVFDGKQVPGWTGTVSALGQAARYLAGGPLIDVEIGKRGASSPTPTRCRYSLAVEDVEFEPPIDIDCGVDAYGLLNVVIEWLMTHAPWVLSEGKLVERRSTTLRQAAALTTLADPTPPRHDASNGQATCSNAATLSTIHRRLLEPLILPRIQRQVVVDKIWPRIEQGIRRAAVIAIVGPAGYGKSVILGDIYDRIRSRPERLTTALVLCSNVFDDDIDQTVLMRAVGTSIGHPEWNLRRDESEAGHLRFILVDTVDLILTPRGAVAFRDFVASVNDMGVSVVFTCRDWEYEEHLERAARFHTLENIDRYRVPAFSDEELREAALGYLAREDACLPDEQRITYVNRLLQMSADARSLDSIVRSPLLLGLVCQLFPPPSLPPAELTTARLFDIYWSVIIQVGRRDGAYTQASIARERLCLAIAEKMYTLSQSSGRVVERVPRQFVTQTPHGDPEALREIRSAGVVVPTEDDRGLRFFHQTLQEYAIARWLTQTEGALHEFMSVFTELDRHDVSPWAPVLRLVLVMSESIERLDLVRKLDLRHFTMFRAAAFAAGAAGDELLAQHLFEIARTQDGEYERTLVTAIDAGLGLTHPAMFGIVRRLIHEGDPSAATEAVVGVASTCNRDIHIGQTAVFCDVLDAACARPKSFASQLCGRFLTLLELPTDQSLPDVCLSALRDYWSSFGDRAQAVTIRAHLARNVSSSARQALWDVIRAGEPPPEISQEIAGLWTLADEGTLPQGEVECAEHLVGRLLEHRSRGWTVVNARVVGRLASRYPLAISQLFQLLIQGQSSAIQGALIALSELCRVGHATKVVDTLLAFPTDALDKNRITAVMSLADEIGLAMWTESPFPVLRSERLVPWLAHWQGAAISALARQSCFVDVARTAVVDILRDLPSSSRTCQVRRVLEILRQYCDTAGVAIPNDFLSMLETLVERSSAEADSAVISADLVRLRGGTIEDAFEVLVPAASSKQRNAALLASTRISEFAASNPEFDPSILTPVLQSQFPGVAANAASALVAALRQRRSPDRIVETLAERFATERDARLVVELLEAAELAMQHSDAGAAALLRAANRQIRCLADARPHNGGVVLGLVRLLSTISHKHGLLPEVKDVAWRLLRTLDIGRVGDGERISVPLIANCGRQNNALDSLVRERPGILEGNATAVAIAIRRVQGSASPLLDDLLKLFPAHSRLRGMVDTWRAK